MAKAARIRGVSVGLLLAVSAAGGAGCRFSGPPPANPALVGAPVLRASDNPLFVAQAQDPQQYQRVYDTAFDVLNDYFDIAAGNIFAGQILGAPRVTAGFFDGPRYSWYDCYQLYESTLQTVRRRAVLNITPAECGGYFVDVQVLKELEDLPQPVHGAGLFVRPVAGAPGSAAAALGCSTWIPWGRDAALEQLILCRLKERI